MTVVEGAQAWLQDYLTGDLGRVDAELAFTEDVLFRMVAVLEKHAPKWLLAELQREDHDAERRQTVARCVVGPMRHQLR